MATEHSQCFSRTSVVSPVVYRETMLCVEQQPGEGLLVLRSCPTSVLPKIPQMRALAQRSGVRPETARTKTHCQLLGRN